MHYLEFLNKAFCPVWKAILFIIPQPLPSLSTGLTLCCFIIGSKVNYFPEDTELQHFRMSHGLGCVSEFLIHNIHGQQIWHLHAPVSCTSVFQGTDCFDVSKSRCVTTSSAEHLLAPPITGCMA